MPRPDPSSGLRRLPIPPAQCIESCTTALKVGYRHIDTAQLYGNEAEVGAAVRQSGLKRADVFITTKILSAGGSFAKSLQKCTDSVDKIDGTEGYVDCFLVHSPKGGKEQRKEMWQALEKLYETDKAKSIGVSNYGIGHIEEMKAYAKVWPPHVNQIEVSWFRPLPCIPSVAQATDLHPAASVVPAKGDRRILPEKQDRR